MWIRHTEELVLFCTIASYGLIISNRKSTALFFDVENLQETKLMNTLHLIFKLKFTFLAPLFWCFELEKGSFGVSSIYTKFFGIIDFKAVNPHINVHGQSDRGEVLNLLIQDEPWIEQELPSLIDHPYTYSLISATRNQLINLAYEDHI